jgi:ferredoxin-type protein NapH
MSVTNPGSVKARKPVKYIKTKRVFTNLRKYAWLISVGIALGGLWEPKLGLLVIAIMAGLMVTAFFNGRFWCGNVCPHGSLFDVILLPLSRNRKIPDWIKSTNLILAFFAFFAFNFGRRVYGAIAAWGVFDFWDRLGFVFVATYLIVMIVGSAAAVAVNPRIWCQFCPMGTIQKGSHQLGQLTGIALMTERKVTISQADKCASCGKCEKACPMQLAPYQYFDENGRFNDENCIKCQVCVANCPLKLLAMENQVVSEKESKIPEVVMDQPAAWKRGKTA